MLKRKNDQKYTLDYTPDTNIPAGLWAYIKMVAARDPIMWTYMITCDVLHALRYPVAFFLVGHVIDILTAADLAEGIPQQIWHYLALLFFVLLIGEACHGVTAYPIVDWRERTRAQLRSDLMAFTLGHSFTYFQDHFAGSLSRKITEGIEKGLEIQFQARIEVLLPLVSMGSAGIVLLGIAPLYSIPVVVFIALIMIPVILKLKKLRNKSQIYADVCSDVTGQVVDTLTNIASVKSFAHEAQEMAEHTRVSEAQMKAWHKVLRAFLVLDNYRRITLVLFGAGMLYACLLGWQYEHISVGDIAAIMGIAFGFNNYAWILSFGIIHLMESSGYLNDSLSTLIKPHGVKDRDGAADLVVRDAAITVENVRFSYPKQQVFDGLHLDIPAGQRVGLIGPSGSGKSTFVNLIQRFFDVNSGVIAIDGQDIASVTQHSLRRAIAVIPQDTSLFHRTLMENIRYGRLEASDADVIEAARKAHALEFIDKLPQGFETMVGERGVKLSGGQRQRIAIARAILKDAPILILDEATSALDSESEKLLQESLEELMRGKTVIAVAHRLSTINHLDRLIVLEQGNIVEDGTHAELLKNQSGLYQRLWSMQSGGFLPE
ncbi:MAG: ABC transporter ATP-binding protein [Bdellovibrionales bacterium]